MSDRSFFVWCSIDVVYLNWFVEGYKGNMVFFCAKDRFIKTPPAPESMSAFVSMVRSVITDSGIRMDWFDISANSTGETVILGCSDIDAGGRFKNPLFLLPKRTLLFLRWKVSQ